MWFFSARSGTEPNEAVGCDVTAGIMAWFDKGCRGRDRTVLKRGTSVVWVKMLRCSENRRREVFTRFCDDSRKKSQERGFPASLSEFVLSSEVVPSGTEDLDTLR